MPDAKWSDVPHAAEGFSSTFKIMGLEGTTPGYVDKADLQAALGGGGGGGAQGNYTATVDPTADDDTADGYSAGSLWFNQTTRAAFICMVATAGAAIWLKLAPDTDFPHLVGRYIVPDHFSRNTAALAADILFLHPVRIRHRTAISHLACQVNTALAGVSVKGVAYRHTQGADGTLTFTKVGVTAPMPTDAAGVVEAALDGGAVVLEPGVLHVGLVSNGAPSMVVASHTAPSTLGGIYGPPTAASALGNASQFTGFSKTVSGSYDSGGPSSFTAPANVTAGQTPIVVAKVAAIPVS